jgi:hypothetical protein
MLTTLAVAALTLFALQAALVAATSAWRPSANIYVTIIIVSLLTAPLAVLADRFLLGEALGRDGRFYLMVMHLSLGGFLFHFMTLPDRSVTLRILVEVLLAPGQALSTRALGERYGVKTMITARLEQLSAARFVEISGDQRIVLTSRGLAFGRFVTAGRTLFGIESAN